MFVWTKYFPQEISHTVATLFEIAKKKKKKVWIRVLNNKIKYIIIW